MPPKKKAKKEEETADPNVASWEYRNDEDGWIAFPSADASLLEHAYCEKKVPKLDTKSLSFNKGYDTVYTFDFIKWTQVNNDSKKARKVRRIAPLSECTWSWVDDANLYVPFFDDDNAVIEKLYLDAKTPDASTCQAKTKKLSWNKGYDSEYTFVFSEMAATTTTGADTSGAGPGITVTGQQKNEESGNVRAIRRLQKKAAWSAAVEGYGISGKEAPVHPAEEPSSTKEKKKPTTTADTSEEDDGKDDHPATLQKATTMSTPAHWTESKKQTFAAPGAHSLVSVPCGTEEFKLIENAVLSTLGTKGAKVKQITRIENVTLWAFYAMTRSHIQKRNGGDANEKLVFYGERMESNMTTICKFGFDTRVGEKGKFGQGLYFGVESNFCDSGRCHKNADKTKDVFVCRAALGKSAVGEASFRRPPPKDKKKPTMDLYDCCSDAAVPPSMYVLFNNNQAYPEYIVKYL